MWEKIIHPSWTNKLQQYISEEEFVKIGAKIAERRQLANVYPASENVFKAFIPFGEIRVVILAMDPYHTPNAATGLCFESGVKGFIPPSLRNIYSELYSDLSVDEGIIDFESWKSQGIFLLNTSLTVEEGVPGSHCEIWKPFTNAVFKCLNETSGLIYLLWGNGAKSFKTFIDPNRNYLLEANHPSPLSANRGGWFGNKHFSTTNEILKQNNNETIQWLKEKN